MLDEVDRVMHVRAGGQGQGRRMQYEVDHMVQGGRMGWGGG